jgi:hypothetical protein
LSDLASKGCFGNTLDFCKAFPQRSNGDATQ